MKSPAKTTRLQFRHAFTLLMILLGSSFAKGQSVYEWYQDGIVIFQLKPDSDYKIPVRNKEVDMHRVEFIESIREKYSIYEMIQMHPNDPDLLLRNTYQIKFEKWLEVDNIVSDIQRHPAIAYAEKKELHKHFLTPNDLGANSSSGTGMWHLYRISAQQAWDLSTGDPNIVVAVTDDAILTTHQDLQNKLVQGYDAPTGGTNPNPCGSNDGNHGTHVSGTVGAETNNSIGVSSIGYNVSIMPVKIGNCNGALTHGYEGINYAANNGADVINMSWGGGGFSTYGQNVCNAAFNAGAILVAAAGNDGTNQQFYPAAYNNVISVASTTTNDAKSSFSQYGTWIDVSAPGSAIRSTYATSNSAYARIQGTSMASPNVAGLVGLIKSHVPTASNQDIINCLLSSADNINTANPTFIGQLGSGRINAFAALTCISAFNLTLDAGITEVLEPTATVCGNTFTPQVRLRNFGTTTLTSATITYNWNGTPSVLNWSGSLAQGQSTIITLPAQFATNGAYTFTAEASNPNGGVDQNPANNNSNSNFTVDLNGQIMTLELDLDCYGSEISWTITNNSGNTIVSGGGYADNTNGQSVTENFCLPIGCYTFAINDTYGDGMYGSQWPGCALNGNYALIDENGNTLVQMTAVNADFDFGTSHSFCVVDPNNLNDAGISAIISPEGIVCSSSILPIVELKNYGNNPLTSVTINFQTNGALQVFNWTGNLATGQSQNVTLPSISAASGIISFESYTTLPNGQTDFDASNDGSTVQLNLYPSPAILPFIENFETNVFTSGEWSIGNPDGDITWELSTVGGITPGSTAAKIDFFNYSTAAQRDALISPRISLVGYSSAELTFDHAYRRFNQSAADSLIVYVSTDCGQNWTRVLAAAENGTGSFATQTTSTVEFTPSIANDWCFSGSVGASCFAVDLTAFVGQDVFVKFESYNAGTIGNNLFIDNINIDGTAIPAPPIPNFSANATEICEGGTIQFTDLSVAGVSTWSWSFPGGNPSSSSVQNPTVSYPSAGTYDVELTVTNSFGTESINIQNQITVNTLPNVSVLATDTDICQGSSVQLTASGANSFNWDNGLGAGSVKTVSPSSTTTYTVVGSNGLGCTANESITITVNPSPTVSVSASETSICLGESVQLTGLGAASYTWDNGLGAGEIQNVSPTVTTTYNVTGTNGISCSNNAAITITVSDQPNVSINPSSLVICEGSDATLAANGADSYLWTPLTDLNTGTGAVVISSPISTITYTVVGSNDCGDDSETVTITVNSAPAQPTIVQNGNVLSVTLQIGETATWSFDGTVIGSGASINMIGSGIYEVVVTNSFDCSSSTISNFDMDTASLNDLGSLSSLSVHPNPSAGTFTVTLNAEMETKIWVIDAIGRRITDSIFVTPGQHSVPFDLSNCTTGIYMLVVESNSQTITRRIMLK
jgi:PKD repeat protein